MIPNALEIASLRKEAELLKKQNALRKAYGLNFYVPHAKQHKFHVVDAVSRYGRTGNRFGKSEMGIAEDLAWCLGGRVWYKNEFDIKDGTGKVVEHHPGGADHPYVGSGIPQHPVKGLLLVVDWDMANKVFTNRTDDPRTCGKLFKLLPHEAIARVHTSRGGHIDQVDIKRPTEYGGGVSTLTIDTIEAWKHNKLGGESADWDFIHVDEPIPEEMFKSYARGLMDRNGRSWFTCTPLDQMWINDDFTPPGRQAPDASAGYSFLPKVKGAGLRYIITGSIYDNPHRSEAGVADFESRLTREEKECRLYGLPLAMAGLVYKEFVWDMHVLCDVPKNWKAYHEPPLDYTIRVAWDVHQRIPQALLFAATAPNGEVFIYDEQFFDSLIKPNAELLQRKIAGRNVLSQIIDPFAVIPSPVTGESVLDELMNYDLYFEKASKDKQVGISKVREKLMERTQSGQPTIWFSPNLAETLFEFTHYVYDTEKNEPKDKDDHMMENFYRLVLNGLEYIAPLSDADYANRRKTVIRPDEYRAAVR